MKFVHYILPFLTALLLYASFHPLNLPVLAWVALVPLIIFIIRERKWWRAFLVSYLVGYIYFATSFYWLRYTVPVGPFLIPIYLALYFAVFALAVRFVVIGRRLPLVAAVPLVWTLLEFVRSFLLTGLPYFYLAHTQYSFFTLIQITDVTGIYGVSFIVAFANGLIAHAIMLSSEVEMAKVKSNVQLRVGVVALAIMLAVSIVYGFLRLNSLDIKDGPEIAIVQANIPQELKRFAARRGSEEVQMELDEIYQKHLVLTEKVTGKPDLVVWSETMFPYPLIYQSRKGKFYNDWQHLHYSKLITPSAKSGVRFLIGCEVGEPPDKWYEGGEIRWSECNTYNSAVYIDPQEGAIGRYYKIHLVPFGEYIPLRNSIPFIDKLIKDYSELPSVPRLEAGRSTEIFDLNGKKFGILICYESIFPELVREIRRKGGDFAVNISNDGWYKDSSELDQMLAITAFRAIENRIGIVRATNTGISAFISPTGDISAMLTDAEGKIKEVEGVLRRRVAISSDNSLYSKFGDIFIYILLTALVVIIVASFIRGKKV